MARCIGAMVLAAALAACGPGPKFAGLKMGPRPTKLSERILEGKLANGLRVVLLPDARTNLVTVGVNYNVGSGDDPADNAGLAHYVEHVMFYAGFLGAEALRDVPLEQNARTMLDRTYFFATALDVDLDRVLDAAARRFEASCEDFDGATLARERDVVIEEAKLRNNARFSAFRRAVFGPDHPYAHSADTSLVDVSHDTVCNFIERYYGPASAVLVVTGNVRDADYQRIRARFERIPARPAGEGVALPTLPTTPIRVTVAGAGAPETVLVFSIPGSGSEQDAAIDLIDGMEWWVAGARITAEVVGDRRARALVLSAKTYDPRMLGERERRLRQFVEHPTFADLEKRKQLVRNLLLEDVDDIAGAGFDLAAIAAQGRPMTRFAKLAALERVTAADLARLFDLSKSHVAYLVPEVGVPADHEVAQLATSLHQVDISHAAARDIAALPARKPFASVQDYSLSNGLRVLLAPDPGAIAVDARLVIADAGGGAMDLLSTQAAVALDEGEGDNAAAQERVRWYKSIRESVFPTFVENATVFRISGLGTFADWHVWHLAWLVLDGHYPASCATNFICAIAKRAELRNEAPAASSVLGRRLAGIADSTPPAAFPKAQLDAFRRTKYRPDSSTLVVAGRFDPDAMRKEIDTLFGGWSASARQAAPTELAVAPSASYVAVPAEDATVSLAIAFASDTEGDRTAREVLVEMLADRLRVVRESLGATYGVHAYLRGGNFVIEGDLEPAYAEQAAKAVATAIAGVRDGDAELANDFARARARLLIQALARPASASGRADALQRIALDRTAVAELEREPDKIRALDLATVQRIAARDLAPGRMIAVARGKRDGAHLTLLALGAAPQEIETFTRTAPAKPAAPKAESMQTASVSRY